MKTLATAFLLGLFGAGALPSDALADVEPPAQYKGYAETAQILGDRLLKPGASFDLGHYLGETIGPFDDFFDTLLDLLGTYKGNSLDSKFRNGDPNVVNVILWHIAMSGIATDTAGLCGAEGGSFLGDNASADFVKAVQPLCAWPAASARSDDALYGFWTALMGFDAPEAEFQAWRDFFTGPAFARAGAGDAIQAMTLAILMNPYFLLRN